MNHSGLAASLTPETNSAGTADFGGVRSVGGRNFRPVPAGGLLLADAIVAEERAARLALDVFLADESDVVVARDREEQAEARFRIDAATPD